MSPEFRHFPPTRRYFLVLAAHFHCLNRLRKPHPVLATYNRILDFTLAIWKESPTAGEIGQGTTSSTLEQKKVTHIFTTVFGGAANIIGTAKSSSISFNIGQRDFSSLERFLEREGVLPQDIAELKTALDSDPTPTTPDGFGPRVSSWIGKMVGKAAQGGWNIAVGAGGTLLAEAIKQYYGF